MNDTQGADYTERLITAEGARWKQVLDVQRLYRRNLARTCIGQVLEVGCGVGRCLRALPGRSLGVDHNEASVQVARSRGHQAMTTEEFLASDRAKEGAFDTLLLAHVLEHMDETGGDELVTSYLPYVRRGGRVVAITPQERGYPTDPTHVRWVDFTVLDAMSSRLGLRPMQRRSFPFPRPVGRIFTYNEFVYVAELS